MTFLRINSFGTVSAIFPQYLHLLNEYVSKILLISKSILNQICRKKFSSPDIYISQKNKDKGFARGVR